MIERLAKLQPIICKVSKRFFSNKLFSKNFITN